MDTHDIQRVLQARYGGAQASDILVQFARIELERPDALTLMQNGKFFEVYGDPARLLGRLLDLRVAEKPLMTGRDGQPIQLAMTGITIGSEREHLRRLLRMGYRIAIGREIEGEREGTIKARELAEVLTPGSVFDEDLLDDERRLLAVVELGAERAGLAVADISTSTLWCDEWEGPDASTHVLDELARLGPAEVICNVDLQRDERTRIESASGITRLEGERRERHRSLCGELQIVSHHHVGRLSPLPGWWFADETCGEVLRSHFRAVDLAPFGLATRHCARRAMGVLLRYVRWNRLPTISRLQSVRASGRGDVLAMDATTRRTLDILTGADGSPYGSLLAVLDHTRTPMGSRLLKSWLTQGLCNRQRLEARYDAVAAAVTRPIAREDIRRSLGQIGDLERVVNRLLVAPSRATPRDMTRLRDALQHAAAIEPALRDLEDLGIAGYDPVPELGALLSQALAPAPRAMLAPRAEGESGELLAGGWDRELDALLAHETQARAAIDRYVETLTLTSGIKSLQLRRDTRTQQLALVVSAADARRVPADWSRVAKSKDQYVTDQLRLLSDDLCALEADRADAEQDAWERLWMRVVEAAEPLLQLARHLAQIDVLTTLAQVAISEDWTRPTIMPERTLSIVNGRHPVVCRTVDGYIPASLTLDDAARMFVLTGPNMSGKSTLMRMVALCVVLAQMGSFVPAEAMTFGLFDRIFTRIGASDDIASGRSTFLVEMSEVATIVHQASADSLVVLDEVGRGTATFDGMALAEAIVEHLHSTTGCRGIFATHYHHLVAMIGHLPGLACAQMGVQRTADGLIFLHSLQPGVAEGSFGIEVARMAGIPQPILARAQQRLAALESDSLARPVEQ